MVVLLLGSVFPTIAQATNWRLVYVAQPLLGEGFIEIADVPFGTDCCPPGAELQLTCESNAIRSVYDGGGGATEDLNVAKMIGLSIDVGSFSDSGESSDTLTVTMDATHADSNAAAKELALDPVMEATVMCLRINAERSFAPGKYLRVRVLGPARIQRFARTYEIAPLPLPKRTYDLDPPPGR